MTKPKCDIEKSTHTCFIKEHQRFKIRVNNVATCPRPTCNSWSYILWSHLF